MNTAIKDRKKTPVKSDLASWESLGECTNKIAISINLIFHSIEGKLIPINNESLRDSALAAFKGLYKIAYDLNKEIDKNIKLIKDNKKPDIEMPQPKLPDPDRLVIHPKLNSVNEAMINSFWLATEELLGGIAEHMPDSPMKDLIATLMKDGSSFIDTFLKDKK